MSSSGLTPSLLPGLSGHRDNAARAWLAALGCSETEVDAVLESGVRFEPNTLKQVFAGVMRLGRAAGRLGETMELLGRQEAAFRHLREEIGIARAAPPQTLMPAAVLVRNGDGWWLPGGWIPDVLDRAAGRDVMQISGAEPRPLVSWPRTVSPRFLFVLTSSPLPEDLPAVPAACSIETADPSCWLSPGPGLVHAVFEAASCMHGSTAVFSS
ncbi:MAG: hypothetical protein OXT73_00260 [Bacteroidota bacterium]|nr:hypothetical protein [Bacteroidota bacterium]